MEPSGFNKSILGEVLVLADEPTASLNFKQADERLKRLALKYKKKGKHPSR